MPNTQYTPYPMTDWSSEISGGSPMPSAQATTSTTTTTTSSASAGQPAVGHNTTTTTTNTASAPAQQGAAQPPMQQGQPSAQQGMAQQGGVQSSTRQPPAIARNEFMGSTGTLDLETHQPIEVIEAPASLNEAFLGSLKSMLLRNRGNFVTATFLIGTQGTTAWEGILHDVGNDYLIIFQPGRERYIACDIYSLKYIEFYDTRRQAMCEEVLRQNGMQNYV